MLGEEERRHALQALAPALDVETLVRAEDIAGLAPVGGFAAHGIDAVHRHHGEDVPAGSVANVDLVFVPRLANNVIAPFVLMHG